MTRVLGGCDVLSSHRGPSGIDARPAGPAVLGCGVGEQGAQSRGLRVVAASPRRLWAGEELVLSLPPLPWDASGSMLRCWPAGGLLCPAPATPPMGPCLSAGTTVGGFMGSGFPPSSTQGHFQTQKSTQTPRAHPSPGNRRAISPHPPACLIWKRVPAIV